jgi:hypothetical protein
MYRAFGLLKPDSDFNLERAVSRLETQFPGHKIARTGDQITIAKGDWAMEMAVVTGPHVPTETQAITDKLAGFNPTETESLLISNRRVEVWSDIPDPFMEHFNDYLLVVEVLKSFNGLIVVDPLEPSLL